MFSEAQCSVAIKRMATLSWRCIKFPTMAMTRGAEHLECHKESKIRLEDS